MPQGHEPGEPQHHTTSARDRIPWIQLIAYGMGGFVPIALFNSVGQLSGLILNVGLGISAIMVGVAQMVPRFWDAITDPLMGYLSDNTKGRWGRRRPYIFIGGLARFLSYSTVGAGSDEQFAGMIIELCVPVFLIWQRLVARKAAAA